MWRNWQTHRPQKPTSSAHCGFDSHHLHDVASVAELADALALGASDLGHCGFDSHRLHVRPRSPGCARGVRG